LKEEVIDEEDLLSDIIKSQKRREEAIERWKTIKRKLPKILAMARINQLFQRKPFTGSYSKLLK